MAARRRSPTSPLPMPALPLARRIINVLLLRWTRSPRRAVCSRECATRRLSRMAVPSTLTSPSRPCTAPQYTRRLSTCTQQTPACCKASRSAQYRTMCGCASRPSAGRSRRGPPVPRTARPACKAAWSFARPSPRQRSTPRQMMRSATWHCGWRTPSTATWSRARPSARCPSLIAPRARRTSSTRAVAPSPCRSAAQHARPWGAASSRIRMRLVATRSSATRSRTLGTASGCRYPSKRALQRAPTRTMRGWCRCATGATSARGPTAMWPRGRCALPASPRASRRATPRWNAPRAASCRTGRAAATESASAFTTLTLQRATRKSARA